jgi:hypothetical protein
VSDEHQRAVDDELAFVTANHCCFMSVVMAPMPLSRQPDKRATRPGAAAAAPPRESARQEGRPRVLVDELEPVLPTRPEMYSRRRTNRPINQVGSGVTPSERICPTRRSK